MNVMAESLSRIGFVGFGAMSRRMAARLRDAGHAVSAFDTAHEGGEIDGFALVESAAALAAGVDAVLVVVPNDAALGAAISGPDGVLEGAHDGLLVVNHSTVSPTASRAAATAAGDRGVRYVEAPMSGSTPEAEKGKLVFLAGGSAADVAAARPLLDAMGRSTVHVGAVGLGAVTKLVINGVMGLGTAALAEGLSYGTEGGVDRDVLIDVLSDLVIVSEHHKHKLAMAKADDFPAEFPTKLMSKDMGLLLDDARERGVPIPSLAAAAQLYAVAGASRADDDYAVAIAVQSA